MDIHERTTQLLVRALIQSAQVLSFVDERFSYRSLEDAIQECLSVAVRDASDPSALADAAAELQRCLQDVGTGTSVPLKMLLLAERHTLLLLVHTRSFPKVISVKSVQPSTTRPKISGNGISESEAHQVANGRLTTSMKAVLLGVRTVQPARARDVIQSCVSLSERTVKRSLKELVDGGYIVRDTSDGSVLYRLPGE